MNAAILIFLLLITAGLGVFFLFFLVMVFDSIVKGHDLPTSRRATKALCKIISEHKTDGSFYDLGCARGLLANRIKKNFPNISVYAADNSMIRIFFAKIRAFFWGQKISFLRKNIFDVDISNADIVYAYLWYDLMPALEEKCQRELKKGAIVITNTTHFSNWKPLKTVVTYPEVSTTPNFETLFIYRKD